MDKKSKPKTKPLSIKERAEHYEKIQKERFLDQERRWLKAGKTSTEQNILDAAVKTHPKKK